MGIVSGRYSDGVASMQLRQIHRSRCGFFLRPRRNKQTASATGASMHARTEGSLTRTVTMSATIAQPLRPFFALFPHINNTECRGYVEQIYSQIILPTNAHTVGESLQQSRPRQTCVRKGDHPYLTTTIAPATPFRYISTYLEPLLICAIPLFDPQALCLLGARAVLTDSKN